MKDNTMDRVRQLYDMMCRHANVRYSREAYRRAPRIFISIRSKPDMPRFRAKPVEVEAVQWRGHNYAEIKAFAGPDVSAPNGDLNKSWDLIVHTAEGVTRAPINFYIVRDDRGNHYPCDPGVFERKYEPLP